jgi:hypothetical protein
MAKKVLTDNFSEPPQQRPLRKLNVNVADGNPDDKLADGEQLMASGTLQYLEGQGLPTCSADTSTSVHSHTERGAHRTTLVPFPLGGLQRSNRVADPPQPQRAIRYNSPQRWRQC